MANNPLNNKYCARATWDASVTTIATSGSQGPSDGVSVWIPEGALITNAYYYVTTTFVDDDAGDSATLALGYTGATGAFVAAIAVSATGTNGIAGGQWDAGTHGTLVGFAGGLDEGDDAGTALENIASKAVTLVPTTTNVELLLTEGGERTFIVGKLDLYVEYVLTGDLS